MNPEPEPGRTFRNVLAVLDGPRDNAAVLRVALPIVSESAGRLTLLGAIPTVPGWAYGGIGVLGATCSWARELELGSAELLSRAARAAPAGISVRTVLARGALATAVLDELERGWQDLVVVSASASRRCRGESPLSRWRVALAGCQLPIIVVAEPRSPRRHRWLSPGAKPIDQ